MQKKCNSLALLWTLILAVALTFVCAPDVASAKSKINKNVKSVKVTNVGKSLTLKKGKTKTLKVKVVGKKKKKVPQTVSFKSSAPKVAHVTKRGKVTAKKSGTARITVTSKANSKKKAVITVRVTAPKKKPVPTKVPVPTKAPEAITMKSASVIDQATIKVSLSGVKKLTVSDFTVNVKSAEAKNYDKKYQLTSCSTSNDRDYELQLDSSNTLADLDQIRVSAKGIKGTAEAVYSEPVQDTFTHTMTVAVNEFMIRGVSLEQHGTSPYTVDVTGLPEGITYELVGDEVRFSGTPVEKGEVQSTVKSVDRFGRTYTDLITWNIKTIAASPYNCLLKDGKARVFYRFDDMMSGDFYGSYSLDGDTYGLEIRLEEGDGLYYIGGTLTEIGTYKVPLTITYADGHKETVDIIINVTPPVTISGTIKDIEGAPVVIGEYSGMYLDFINCDPNKGSYYNRYSEGDGNFSFDLEPGIYDITARGLGEDYYIKGQDLTADRSDFTISQPVRKVTIKPNNPDMSLKEFGYWMDEDGKSQGYQNTLYLKDGASYKWTKLKATRTENIKAEVSFTVSVGTTEVYADIISEAVDTIQLNTPKKISAAGVEWPQHKYVAFTPEESGTYRFDFDEYISEPETCFENAEGESLPINIENVYDEENGTHTSSSFIYECEAGATYYIGTSSNLFIGKEFSATLCVSPVEPVATALDGGLQALQ